MKKTLLISSMALAALMILPGCADKCGKSGNACDTDDMVYTGMLPAADADGVRYTLTVDYDDDDNDGDFDLVETYVAADTVGQMSYRDVASFKSKGDFKVVDKEGKKYLVLKPGSKKTGEELTFLVASDSTLTLVNNSFEPAADSTMNYTLRLVK